MKRLTALRGGLAREDGQALVLVALAMIVLIGFAALVIDVGRVWVAQKKLQNAVDAAALVAGQELPNATNAYNAAVNYSASNGDKNVLGGYNMTPNAATVTFECVSHGGLGYTAGSPPTCPTDTSSTNCKPSGAATPTPSGVTTCNAVHVQETATVKTTLGAIFFPNFTVSAGATAAAAGGTQKPLNVFVILDNTQSMTQNCSSTVTGITGTPQKLDCAKAGMRAFLQALSPCSSTLTTCGSATANGSGQLGANVSSPVDEVGLEVIPAISGNPPSSTTLNKEVDCNSSSSFTVTYPTYSSYTYNSGQPDGGIPSSDDYIGYQAVGLSSDYRPSFSNTTLNATTSNLVEAVDWGQCPSGLYPNGNYYGLKDIGGQGSYLAGAITEAQHLLNQNARTGAENDIVILSDGQMNHPKTFTDNNPCQSAVDAATQAKAAGTNIYAIAYGSNGTACPDTGDSLTDLQTMKDIASSSTSPYFIDEPTTGDVTADFQQFAASLTQSRLIPDCTQAPPNC